MAVINGDGGNNTISGSQTGDQISGGAGDDSINGQNGGDLISGGTGDDNVGGGGGQDKVKGNEGDDVVNGGANKDVLVGNGGNDIVDGGSSDDKISGRSGADYMYGGGGNDKIMGGGGSDYLEGGNGNDRMFGTNRSNGDGAIDYFAFDTTDGSDQVFNFELGIDKIYLKEGGTATLTYDASNNSTQMEYGGTSVKFKNVDLTTGDQGYLFADTAEVNTWSMDNFDGDIVI